MHNLNGREFELAYWYQVKSDPLDKVVAQVLSLSSCTSLDNLQQRLGDITTALGFDHFLYGVRFTIDGPKKSELVLTNYKFSWREKYQREGYAQIDPIVSHAVMSLRPLVWTPQLFSTEASLNFREEAAHHGLASGVTFPIHGKEGDVALLSFANSTGGEDVARHNLSRLPLGVLAATLAHESVRLIVQAKRNRLRPTLTKREIEILKWISIGKTTWEISRLLTISEHGVSFHVRKIMEKFDVSSRHQAVAKAASLGLLG